jgi:exodeoxyribonuclease X
VIRVVDIETTGMSPGEGAEVIELGWHDIGVPCFGVRLFGCERPCPPEVRAVHHIHPSEYEGFPLFDSGRFWSEATEAGIQYVAAHNAEFEQQFLGSHALMPWLCTYRVALRLWPDAPHHGNQSLMYWLGLDTELDEGRRHPPHRALPDAYVTAAILQRQLCEVGVEQMSRWTSEPRLLPTCPIGKFRGRPWAEVESGFLSWMLRQPDMEADLRWNAQRELDRRRTEAHRGD